MQLIVPKMMYYSDPKYIWYGGGWFKKKRGFLPSHRGLNQLDKITIRQNHSSRVCPTCCLLIDKQVFDDIGLMDEKYFVYFDDTDFCFSILKKTEGIKYIIILLLVFTTR